MTQVLLKKTGKWEEDERILSLLQEETIKYHSLPQDIPVTWSQKNPRHKENNFERGQISRVSFARWMPYLKTH